ncbi:DUF2845 domain-containing protein [Bradyrhizobium acaciae]|uniref:DUF2845 domain-containing protein n=1 Tax=Bradyrhizobium acaciae TaxID=2683706 RepID=UPI001E2B6F49|nr:DUF2845 domain-containing protein [Bradyrhizobium acaciae]MCC8980741.1 hypothetical protein [Bradyrhizobium acaciae]
MRLLLVGLFPCGFATTTFADELEDYQQLYRICQEKGRPTIGMTEAQVEASCWGKPIRIYDVPDGRVGWTYQRGFLFFTDGKLSEIAAWREERR